MKFLLWFFRDFLDGPLYIIVVIINTILICAGIGYFAEKSQIQKKKKQEFNNNYVPYNNQVTNQNNITSQNTIFNNNYVPNNGMLAQNTQGIAANNNQINNNFTK